MNCPCSEQLREQSIALQGIAWSRMDGGQECGLSANLADQAADVIDDLLAALIGLRDILNRAESNASGFPEWEAVSSRINAARAAISKATAA